jgi:hypothetical protein
MYAITSEIEILILDTYHPDTLYVVEQGCVELLFLSKPKRVREEKR